MNQHQVTANPPMIPEILQRHLEELQFLCGQFQHALHSPDYRHRDLDPFLHAVDPQLLARSAIRDQQHLRLLAVDGANRLGVGGWIG